MEFDIEGLPEKCKNCTMLNSLECPDAINCPLVKLLVSRVMPALKTANDRLSTPPEHLFKQDNKIEEKSIVHAKNKMNELSGPEWMYYTRSVWVTSFPSRWAHHLRKKHGANKPPDLMRIIIEVFSKPDDLVLDPFAGVGGTLIGASICSSPRKAIGIEINQEWIKIYEEVIRHIREKEGYPFIQKQEIIHGDALKILKQFEDESVGLVATDPPYNIHLDITMSTGKYERFRNRKTNYNMRSDREEDLANLKNTEEFFKRLISIFKEVHRVLKTEKYLIIIIRNSYQEGRYQLNHARIANELEKIGFVLKADIIWVSTGMKLRPYGYPYSYVPNIIHQHILVLKKTKTKKGKKKS